MDGIVLLTPAVALAIVLLLGFAGCVISDPVHPPPPTLTARVRVPSPLTTTELWFAWEPPSTPPDQVVLVNPSPTFLDGADNVFDRGLLPMPESGAWTVRCRVRVEGSAVPGAVGFGTFILDGSLPNPIATFQVVGSAADLAVVFVGVS